MAPAATLVERAQHILNLARDFPDLNNYKELAYHSFYETKTIDADARRTLVINRPTYLFHAGGNAEIEAYAPLILLGSGKGNIILNARDNVLVRNINGNLEASLRETSYLEGVKGKTRIYETDTLKNMKKIILCPKGTCNGTRLGAREMTLNADKKEYGHVVIKGCPDVEIPSISW